MLIGVDLDDVLAETFFAFDQFHNETYGTSFKKEDHFTFDLTKFWNISPKETRKRVIEFNASKYSSEIIPIVGAKEGLLKLSKQNELIIITSRLEDTKKGTKQWLKKHFPDHDFEVHFANHYYGIEHQKKSHICQNLGVEVLIDDCLEYAIECAETGVRVILLNSPWNQADKLPENVTRVKDWEEILEKIELLNNYK